MTRRDWLVGGVLVGLLAVLYMVSPKNQSGWVLWEKRMTFRDGGEATTWEPLDGFERLGDCHRSGQEIVADALEFMRSGGRKLLSVRPDGRSAAYAVEGDAQHTVDTRYLCFPGAFDPRVPVAAQPGVPRS
jgi:hypothetical protein